MTEQRRLAAIVSADVAGYSRLMGRDESGTLAALKALRQEVVDPAIASHGGRIVKTTGDGLLLEFRAWSMPCAARSRCRRRWLTAPPGCRGSAHRLPRRHQHRRHHRRWRRHLWRRRQCRRPAAGDRGTGRHLHIEPCACRMCATVSTPRSTTAARRHSRTLLDRFRSGAGSPERWHSEASACSRQRSRYPDKPSIAVLPFQNMSGDPEQEYFADGMVEDIITGAVALQVRCS